MGNEQVVGGPEPNFKGGENPYAKLSSANLSAEQTGDDGSVSAETVASKPADAAPSYHITPDGMFMPNALHMTGSVMKTAHEVLRRSRETTKEDEGGGSQQP